MENRTQMIAALDKVYASATYQKIKAIVQANRVVGNRLLALKIAGFNVENGAMGSGGTLRAKRTKDKNVFKVQVSCGMGKYNYANYVTIIL